MRALSIAHTEASMGWGGQEIRILTEARGFLARGHRVVLYARTRVAHRGRSRRLRGAVRGGADRPQAPRRRRRAGAGVSRLASRRRQHAQLDRQLARRARLPARCATPPAIVRTRHISVPVPNDPATRWLYRRATARVVTTGEVLAQQLVRDVGLDPARVESIPTGIDASGYGTLTRDDARRSLGLPLGVPIVGIVATLRSWKGHRHLVDAIARMTHRHAQLAIVGDGPQREALERHVAALGLAKRVRFAGQQRDVAPWLAALDVFALPSIANEGVPQALLQAMVGGGPVRHYGCRRDPRDRARRRDGARGTARRSGRARRRDRPPARRFRAARPAGRRRARVCRAALRPRHDARPDGGGVPARHRGRTAMSAVVRRRLFSRARENGADISPLHAVERGGGEA